MPTTALVFWILAIALAAFGVVFILFGQSGERGYWAQRDPHGDARKDATGLGAVAKRAGHFAAGEYRASLRIMAIGVLMIWAGIACAVVALLIGLLA